ncbi:hypothetical protein ACFQ5J_02740 [Lacticaseibacillus baoqingensis]|uniref:Uncharacterized protein n=1 Tax=Lacticaseibacillus baoqingensis TaxID=2486013 RepID=A0ABW4E5T9_9LACO|nr:hypothetical protein [Lacticaseibacillus baoqingensis]
MSKTPFALALASGAATIWLHHHFWHQTLPNRRLTQVQTQAAQLGAVSGGWIAHTPVPMNGGDVLLAGYAGGVIVDGQPQAFVISANGRLLRWGDDVKARH